MDNNVTLDSRLYDMGGPGVNLVMNFNTILGMIDALANRMELAEAAQQNLADRVTDLETEGAQDPEPEPGEDPEQDPEGDA